MPRKKIIRSRGKCEICGVLIPHKQGMPAKTCGAVCAAERKRRRETARYHRVKHTPQWKATRAAYLEKLRVRLDADPEYAALFHAYQHEQVRKNRIKRHADPVIRARELAAKREERRQWREILVQDAQAWEAHKAKCRAWYHGLSEAERKRIFLEPQRRRIAAKRQVPSRKDGSISGKKNPQRGERADEIVESDDADPKSTRHGRARRPSR